MCISKAMDGGAYLISESEAGFKLLGMREKCLAAICCVLRNKPSKARDEMHCDASRSAQPMRLSVWRIASRIS